MGECEELKVQPDLYCSTTDRVADFQKHNCLLGRFEVPIHLDAVEALVVHHWDIPPADELVLPIVVAAVVA